MINSVVMCFGRFSVLHAGHDLLINTMKSEDGKVMIFPSKKEFIKSDPLLYYQKLYFLQNAYGDIVKDTKVKNIIEALEYVSRISKNVIVYSGSDRVKDFEKLKKYNNVLYTFDSVIFKHVGNRENTEGIESYSASSMREYVKNKNKTEFLRRCSTYLSLSDKKMLYDELEWIYENFKEM